MALPWGGRPSAAQEQLDGVKNGAQRHDMQILRSSYFYGD